MKLSIIVPVYNVEKYLPKCLDSLVNQTYKDIEIICVNDGSSDNSLQVLNEYASQDNRIKVINQENLGVSTARNIGIDNATGDYILFVDADDWLELDACTILIDHIEKYQSEIIYFKLKPTININDSYKVEIHQITKFDNKHCNKVFKFKDNYKMIFNELKSLMCGDKVFKTKFIKSHKIYYPNNIVVLEDAIFSFRCFLQNPSIVLCNEYLYNYIINTPNSLTKINLENRLQNLKKAIGEFEELAQFGISWLNKYIYAYFINYLLYYWRYFYFSKYKKDFLNLFTYVIYKYKQIPEQNDFHAYKRATMHLLLSKLHLSWWYWKLIYPFGKHCIVLPYRRIKNFLRSK